MQVAKCLTHFQPSTCVNKNEQDFSAPNSTDPEQDYDRIHRRHPDYEIILTIIKSKTMKDCVKDRIDTILISIALLKQNILGGSTSQRIM